MGFRIYEEGRTHIPLISPTTIGPLAGIQDRLGLYKINHITVSFTGHYNAISFDRLPQKTKIGKRFMKIILSCQPEFSSARNTFFLLKTQKAATLQQVTGGKTADIVLKRMLELFLNVAPLRKIFEF